MRSKNFNRQSDGRRWRLFLGAIALLGLVGCTSLAPYHPSASTHSRVEEHSTYRVGFSPKGESLSIVLSVINQATQTLSLAAYSLTSKPIANALLEAKARGVNVRVLADKRDNIRNKNSVINILNKGNVPIRLNGKYAIFHHKFIVADGRSLQTGSFNYSESAVKRNAENVLWIPNDPVLATRYEVEYEKLWLEADVYVPGDSD